MSVANVKLATLILFYHFGVCRAISHLASYPPNYSYLCSQIGKGGNYLKVNH